MAFIALVPKEEGESVPNEFRPISLLNGVYKLITRSLQ